MQRCKEEIILFMKFGIKALPTEIITLKNNELFHYPRMGQLRISNKTFKKETTANKDVFFFTFPTFLGDVYIRNDILVQSYIISSNNIGSDKRNKERLIFANIVFENFPNEVHNHLGIILREDDIIDIIRREKETFNGESRFESWYLASMV